MILRLKLSVLLTAGLLIPDFSAEASSSFSLYGGTFADLNGVPTTAGTLFQLVNLGPNGVFDSIDFYGPSRTGLERWVGGDDSVITASYLDDTEFSSMAAFDHHVGADSQPGIVERNFKFTLSDSAKFGIRWFPGLKATQFDPNLSLAGQYYGEFTRQDDPNVSGPMYDGARKGGLLWVYSDGLLAENLDNLHTASLNGPDPDFLGRATNFIPAPEPSSAALAAFGVAGMLGLRRRRS